MHIIAAAEVQSRAYYWNEEFQTISEKIRGVDLYDEEQVYVSMANLYQDFEHVVRVFCFILFSFLCLSIHHQIDIRQNHYI